MKKAVVVGIIWMGLLLGGCDSESSPEKTPPPEPESGERVTFEGIELDELGISVEDSLEIAVLSERLPFPMKVRFLEKHGVELDFKTQTFVKGAARVERPSVSRGYAIAEFAHAETARIVQVRLGGNQPEALLGKIMMFATATTPAPVLRDDRGEVHLPVGYMIQGGGWAEFKFGLDEGIRVLSEIPLARVGEKDEVRLIYHVGVGRKVVSFELGRNVQPLNLEVVAKGE